MANPIAVPGTVVQSGALVSPAGAQGPPGPNVVSADAGNIATLGSDSLVYVPAAALTSIPIGTILDSAAANAPAGFLFCFGQAVSRTTYSNLYAALGGSSSPFGQGDGSTTFNVPDCRGRTSIGTGQGTGLTNRNLGDIVSNEETHALTVAEEAVHTHSVTQGTHTHTDSGHAHYCGGVDHLHSDDHYHTWPLQGSHTHGISDGGHNHNYTAYPQGQVQGAAGAGAWTTGGGAAATTAAANQANAGLSIAAANTPAGNTNYKSQSGFSNSTGAADRSLAFNSNNASAVLSTDSAGAIACANAGSGAAHNNMQPSLAFNRIIKT